MNTPPLGETQHATHAQRDEGIAWTGLIWEWSMKEEAHEGGLDLDGDEGSILNEAVERDVKTENDRVCLSRGKEVSVPAVCRTQVTPRGRKGLDRGGP